MTAVCASITIYAGEISVIFLALSGSLYALLASLAVFPSSSSSVGVLFHQRLVLLLYFPTVFLLFGPQLAAVGLVFRNPGPQHETFISAGEQCLTCLALLPMLLSSWFARRGKSFPSPPSIRQFVSYVRAQIEEEALRAKNGGHLPHKNYEGEGGRRGFSATDSTLAALDVPNGHGSCNECLHEDGAKNAVFVETDAGAIAVGKGVMVGPGFRVIACDCPSREPAAPSTWCEFCRCVCATCGGCKEAVRAIRRSNAADGRGARRGAQNGGVGTAVIGPASVVGIVSACVVCLGLWGCGIRMLREPCHCMWGLGVIGVVLCGMRWAVDREAMPRR